MENYYYNLAELPETYDKEQVVKFLGKHRILACEVGEVPKNKHIGSGAWHDDILAFLIENFKPEVEEVKSPVETKKKVTKKVAEAPAQKVEETPSPENPESLPNSTDNDGAS